MIFATNNRIKLKQIKELCEKKIDIVGLKEFGIDLDVNEDGKTFEENAIKKAIEIYKLTKQEVLSDDSGLCIDYFDGWPGIYSRRFIPNSTPKEKIAVILDKMQNVSEDLRGARHICVLAFVDKKGNVTTFKGIVDGKIAFEPRGENLFGFDPIFVLPNGKTLAELSDLEKIKVNARSVAFKEFLKWYKK